MLVELGQADKTNSAVLPGRWIYSSDYYDRTALCKIASACDYPQHQKIKYMSHGEQTQPLEVLAGRECLIRITTS